MKLCGFDVGLDKPFFLMAGPCVIESEEMVMEIAREMKAICDDLGIPYIFKASYDKANRTSVSSFRGPGIEKGLEILARVRETVGVPVVTDVHAEARGTPRCQVRGCLTNSGLFMPPDGLYLRLCSNG